MNKKYLLLSFCQEILKVDSGVGYFQYSEFLGES